VRTQSPPFVAEEVFSDLAEASLLHVGLVAVDGAAGFVQFDDGHGFIVCGFVAVMAADHVAV
jgi:hypothetical protein